MAEKIQHAIGVKKSMRRRRSPDRGAQDPVVQGHKPAPLALRQAMAKPAAAAPGDILALQRAAGNRAVSGLIQAKLTVGAAGDRYEQEADRVAEQVAGSERASSSTQESVQRQEEEEIQAKPLAATIIPLVQRQEEEEEVQTKPLVQRRANADGSFEVGRDVESQLASHRGGGSPLPTAVRAFMEPRFGADFSGVRLHSGGKVARLNRELSAQAFTNGTDIYLGERAADPASPAGRKLIAHELTHVIQQDGTNNRIARWGKPHGGTGHDELTKEAFATLEPEMKRWYSSEAQEYLAGYSESIDIRVGFLGGSWLLGKMYEYLGYKPKSAMARGIRKAVRGVVKGAKGAGWGLSRAANWMTRGKLGMSKQEMQEAKLRSQQEAGDQTVAEKKRIAAAYDNIKWYWRKSTEAPTHGEAGKYQGDGAAEDAARVNGYVKKAVTAWKGKNKNQALSILGLALHATQDRGAHGDGKPGTGHDPRLCTPPPNEYARTDIYDPENDGANCDRRGQNAEGWDFAVGLTQEVLANFAYGIGLSGKKELTEEDLEAGAKLKAFEQPNKLKRFARKTGIFFGKDIIKV
jgi:hypothetical protein